MNQLMNQTLLSDTDYIQTNYLPEAEGNSAPEAAAYSGFDAELTAGAVYDALQERLALARTRALMGEHAPALALLRSAHAEYATYRDALQGFPLHSLEHAFTVTMQALCVEAPLETDVLETNRKETHTQRGCDAETPLALTVPELLSESVSESAGRGVERKTRSRKRASKAA